MSRKYNYIYSKLVEDRYDLAGHIAYALYKQDKIEYIANFKSEKGVDPTEQDLEPFNTISCSQGSLEKYRLIAYSTLQSFIDNSIEDYREEIKQDLKDQQIQLLREELKPLQPPSLAKSYLHGIIQSVIGAFLFMLLLCGLLFALSFADNQYSFTFGGKGGATIEKTQSNKTPDTNTSSKL